MKNIFILLSQWVLSCIGVFILVMFFGKFSDETSGLILVLFIISSFVFQILRFSKMNGADLISKFRTSLNTAVTRPVIDASTMPPKEYVKYTKLSSFTKFILGINLFNFVLFALQYVGFIFLGPGGFIFTLLARILNPINSVCTLVLFIITIIFWKKSHGHAIQLIPYLFYEFANISQYVFNYYANTYGAYTFAMNGEIIVQILGVLIALIAYFKYKRIPIDTQTPKPLS